MLISAALALDSRAEIHAIVAIPHSFRWRLWLTQYTAESFVLAVSAKSGAAFSQDAD